MIKQTPALGDMWYSPLVPAGRKRDILDKILGRSFDDLTLSFLRLLIDKRREHVLTEVEREMQDLTDVSRNVVRAEAIFAVEPTAEEKTALTESLQHRTGGHVDLTVRIDPAILGGIVVRMQDTIIDGSVRGTFERLREQMLNEA